MFEVIVKNPSGKTRFVFGEPTKFEMSAWADYQEADRAYGRAGYIIEVHKDGKKFSAKDGDYYRGPK
jgi:hypothetical protein